MRPRDKPPRGHDGETRDVRRSHAGRKPPAPTTNLDAAPPASAEERPSDGVRFADLLRDARPIARGPARVERLAAEPTRRGAKRRGAGEQDERVERSTGFRRPDAGVAHLAAAYGISDRQLAGLERGEPEPEERIDLHGLRADDAKRVLRKRIESAVAQTLRCVIVVHGMGKRSPTGEATLRDAVPVWLTRGALGRLVLAIAPAPRRLGGEGATMVLLRKT